MPVFSLTLEETNRSILSSVYYKIIDDISDVIKIPKDSLVILYKDTEIALTDARPNTTAQSKLNTPTTTTKRRIQATITEDYNEDNLGSTAVHRQEFYPIFRDQDISVEVAPVYIQTDVEIEFVYVTPSMAEAKRIRDDIRLRLSQMRNIGHHEVEYNIIIPTVVEDFIADVHELKNRLYPQDLGEYFLEHATKRIHQITDMGNKENVRLAVYEKQVRILGLFNFSSMPDKVERDGDASTYKLAIKYTFSLSVPKAMTVRYPTLICNRPLPSKYLSFIEENKINSGREYKRESNYIGFSLYNLSHFEAHRQLENRVDINVPINIPLFDDFSLRQGHKGYGILVSLLPEVDESDNRTLLNLRDIDPYYIPDKLLQFLIDGERNYITNPYASFMYLGLHQEDRHYDNPVLEVTEDLTVKSKLDINICKPVRVTLSFNINFSMMLPEVPKRILSNTYILLLFISEYISAVNTFKNEAARLGPPDMGFYYFLIDAICKRLDLDDLDTVKAIFDIIGKDLYTSSVIARLLLTEFPDLLRRLQQVGIASVVTSGNTVLLLTGDQLAAYNDPMSQARLNLNKGSLLQVTDKYFVDRSFLMKSVMEAAVVALKRET